jgi:hypothetical protein
VSQNDKKKPAPPAPLKWVGITTLFGMLLE